MAIRVSAMLRRTLVLLPPLAAGVHRQTVNVWLKRYRERGEKGVLDGRRV